MIQASSDVVGKITYVLQMAIALVTLTTFMEMQNEKVESGLFFMKLSSNLHHHQEHVLRVRSVYFLVGSVMI